MLVEAALLFNLIHNSQSYLQLYVNPVQLILSPTNEYMIDNNSLSTVTARGKGRESTEYSQNKQASPKNLHTNFISEIPFS